jgi:hypothetical protein
MAQARKNAKRIINSTIAGYEKGLIKTANFDKVGKDGKLVSCDQKNFEVNSLIADTKRREPVRELVEDY